MSDRRYDLKDPYDVAVMNVCFLVHEGHNVDDAIHEERYSGRVGIMGNLMDWGKVEARVKCSLCGSYTGDKPCESCKGIMY